jgi:hypothetical protein
MADAICDGLSGEAMVVHSEVARRATSDALLAMSLLLASACSSNATTSRSISSAPVDTGAAGSTMLENPRNQAAVDNPGDAIAGGPASEPPRARATAPAKTEPMRSSVAMDECPGNLSPSLVSALQAGDVPRGQRWLYPYDKTVFPRGLLAPLLQWDGPAAEAIYFHMRSNSFDYKGCFTGGAAANFAIPQATWNAAGAQSDGQSDPLQIELTLSSGGKTQRLPTLTVIFALANIKSAIYYNTYGSAIANAKGIIGGVVMRIAPGKAEPDVFVTVPTQDGDCVGCHSVSAGGSRMIAETHGALGISEVSSASYDLSSSAAANPPVLDADLKRAGFAALTPDGSKFLIQGSIAAGPTGPLSTSPVGNVPGSFGPQKSALFETDSGKKIADSGIVPYPYMPMFSVDGKTIVFNNMDMSGEMAGHTLALMDFDNASNKFSDLRTVYQNASRFPAWPFFLPTVMASAAASGAQVGRRVIFALGESDFATQEQPWSLSPHHSDLIWLDIDSGSSALLNSADGLDATGKSYLPYGDRDVHLNFYPTVSPVAAGGYFWLFFTSKRNYGNVLVTDPPDSHSEAKKIWVSAIDIDAAAGSDPSHPAFLLPGQELQSGNARAFASLEACHAEADSCASGIDCCCGFCTDNKCVCKQTPSCAKLDEKCSSAADCCDNALSCIGGFCAEVILN